jgi:hypothetical protein
MVLGSEDYHSISDQLGLVENNMKAMEDEIENMFDGHSRDISFCDVMPLLDQS